MIPKNFLKPLLALDRKFGPIYLVGGALRDKLLSANTPIADFDLITSHRAEELAQAFALKTKGRLVRFKHERKIYRVVLPMNGTHCHFDFANFQGPSLEDDLANRDFTINTLALPLSSSNLPRLPSGQGSTTSHLNDLFNATRHLKEKKLQALSERSFISDPLRLLRAFRFAATLGFKIEPKTFSWIKRHAKKINRCAAERARQELLEIFRSPNTAQTLRRMDKAGLLTAIFPELEKSRGLAIQYYKNGGVLGHVLESVDCFEKSIKEWPKREPRLSRQIQTYMNEAIEGSFPRYTALKLAVLVHDIAKPRTAKMIDGRLRFFGHDEKGAKLFEKIGTKLRFSTDEIELISKIIRAHLRPGNLSEQPTVTDRAIYRFFRDLGEDGIGVLLAALADHQSYMSEKQRWSLKEPAVKTIMLMLKRYYLEQAKVVPPKLIDGHDVMRTLKIAPGRKVGKILERVQSLQAEGKIKTREQALARLRSL